MVARPSTRRALTLTLTAVTAGALVTTTGTAAAAANPWTRVDSGVIASRSAQQGDVRANRLAGFTLDRAAMAAALAGTDTAEVALPTPAGTFERFTLVDTPVMEPGLAAKHPEIRTFTGKSAEDPTATVRADLTPLGFHASVRSERGQWFVDPYSHRDQGLYASYYGHDLSPAAPLLEAGVDYAAQRPHTTAGSAAVRVRTYRLAIITDPSYARYVGAENVTAAKVSLVNRIAQIYEDEAAIRLLLVNDSDRTNLDTDALATGPNGPCGSAPCFRPDELERCVTGTLGNAATVLGQLIGASNYEIGHVAMGVRGGGAGVPGVGGPDKAAGCTGITTPTGDFFAVDYVAHEIGHQFGAEHTFNGDQWGCGTGQRVEGSSYEPGSGVTIMSYAGICQQDNLQRHNDPYFSHRSRAEIGAFTTSTRWHADEVQNTALRDFDDGDSFTLTYDGRRSAPITHAGYGREAIKTALEAILPDGGQVDVVGFGDNVNRPSPFDTTGFQVTFTGTLQGVNVPALGIDALGATGHVGETIKGGEQDNRGHRVERTRNHPPVVTTAERHTIPTRTPFALTGRASDPDGDTVTYLWEQDDRGGETGTSLVDNTKTDGPLFRVFGTAAVVTDADALEYYSPGQNTTTTNPKRVFPDLAQIAAGHTNAATGTCPAAPPPPAPETGGGTNVPADVVDCYSEFLPTADWVGVDGSRTLHFKLTARDGARGGGGIGSADTALTVAPGTGPFLVTSHASRASHRGGSRQQLTWDVAGTAAAPVGTTAVRITFSTDGGLTFPHVLASRTRNDGAETVTLPRVRTDKGRIRIEAVGNVFFDLNDADLTVTG